MQLTPWHRYLYRVVIGSILIVFGIAEILLVPLEGSIIPAVLLAAGFTFLVNGVTRWRKFGDTPEKDERTRRIGAWGLSYSWLLSLFFMAVLFWLDYLRIVPQTAGTALGISIIVMTLSAVIFQLFLSRRGDVE